MNGNNGAAALIVVEVSDEPIITSKPYTDPKTGMVKPPSSKQMCYVHFGARYPVAFKMKVPDEGPRRPGMYMLGGRLFKPSQYDGLDFTGDRELDLIPVGAAIDALKSITSAPKLAAAS
jgi:hypothetical protein